MVYQYIKFLFEKILIFLTVPSEDVAYYITECFYKDKFSCELIVKKYVTLCFPLCAGCQSTKIQIQVRSMKHLYFSSPKHIYRALVKLLSVSNLKSKLLIPLFCYSSSTLRSWSIYFGEFPLIYWSFVVREDQT